MTFLTVVIGALVFVGTAQAVPPRLVTLGQQARHPQATISAPRAESVTIFASKPDRATDGSFLSENVKEIDFLTTSEIQSGSWLYEQPIDPATYYVMMRASAESSCYSEPPPTYNLVIDPACADGYSDVVRLTIPKPVPKYRTSVTVYKYLQEASLTITATPWGDDLPYRVCYRLKTKRTRCLRDTINGYDWSSSASGHATVNTRNLPRRATFTWYVGSRKIGSRTVRVR